MSQSNLTRGLLLSTLLLTLSLNYASKVSAQVINDFSSSMARQEQNLKSQQDLLQQIDILQEKAEKFRKTVDSFNFQLQEQFNAQRKNNTVDFKQLLANWEQLNRIWHDFDQELEQNPEFSNLLEGTKVFHDINKNLLFQKEIISNLAKVLNKSSVLITTEFQKQIFTKGELNHGYYPYGTFETKTQHKFALISTNKARELELQVSQIENILSNHLLNREQINNSNYKIVGATRINTTNTKEPIDDSAKQSDFLNFKTLMVLILLSSCAIYIILKSYRKNSAASQNQDIKQDRDAETSQENVTDHNNVADYLYNVQQFENQAREILNSTNQILENQKKTIENEQNSQTNNSPSSPQNQIQTKFNSAGSSATKTFVTKTPKQVVQKSSPTVTSLLTEEDLILMYHENRKLLFPKIIKVEVTRESLERIKTGQKSEIFFEEASHGSYWIVIEPKLENNCYFLVPNPIVDINSLIPQCIDNIFICTRYNNRTSDKFNLKFSAIVQVHSSSSWKLIGTGEITFS